MLVSITLEAQEKAIFRHLGKEDGLSQGSVFAITQDADGYIWLGTRDGLNKYDGYEFTVYRNDPERKGSLSGNDIRTLYFDSMDSTLWVGTFKGLSKYDASVDTFHNYTIKDGLNSEWIQSILRDKKGNLWVGTSDGLNLFFPDEDRFVNIELGFPPGVSLRVNTVYEDDNGDIFLGMQHGVYQLVETTEGSFQTKAVISEFQNHYALPNYNIQSILRDKHGYLWIGSQGGVFKFSQVNKKPEIYRFKDDDPNSLSNNSVRQIAQGPDGDIWIGTLVGLNKYVPKQDNFMRFTKEDVVQGGLSNGSIWSVFFDRNGGLWLGTYHGGVNYNDPAFSRFTNYEYIPNKNSLSHNVISSFVEDQKGNLWIGTEGGGLNYLDRLNGNFTTYLAETNRSNSLSGNNVKCLLKDGNKLWIGTFKEGISCLNLSDMTFHRIEEILDLPHVLTDNDVYRLLKEGERLWVLTYGGGLNLIDLETKEVYAYQHNAKDTSSISSDDGRVVLNDSRNRIWIGTEKGLDLVVRKSFRDVDLEFRRFFKGFKIYSLFEDKRGILWIGTFSNGLFEFNPENHTFRQYTEKDGLPGRTIFGILQDESGLLWLSTNNGLSRLDIHNNTFANYNNADGLQNLEFNYNAYYKALSGELFFGGTSGFTVIQPSEILTSQTIPPLVFTNLEVYNKKVNVIDDNSILDKVVNQEEELTFAYNEAIFSIGLAALDYHNPSSVKYAYKLDGLDNDWNYTVGKTEANYTIQIPGTYVFRAKAANSDGIWNDVERQLQIRVLPPPWLSGWAYLIYALLTAGGIFGVWYFIRLRNKLHLERLAKQQQKELNELKLRFFTNITHELRTPLTLILGPLDELIHKYAADDIRHPLQAIGNNAQRLLNLVNQILTFRKLESDHEPVQAVKVDIVIFVKKIFEHFEESAQLREINYTFNSIEDELEVWFDPEKLEKVFFNLLSNAFKFTPNQGRITVEIHKKLDDVQISVSDNGNGIKQELHEQIFKRFYEKVAISAPLIKGAGIGLALSRQMAELHHGKLWVESEVGKGATFFVEIPLGKEHFQTHELSDNKFDPTIALAGINHSEIKSPDFSWLEESNEQAPADAPLILLVEDNEEVLQYIHSIFNNSYRIETATNGKEGLVKAKQLNPDLIISDIMMPEMDGMMMCEKVKSNIKTSHIPVILLTARSAQTFKNEGLQSGADGYVTKPFNPDELRLRARNIIRHRQTMREKFVRIVDLEPKEITVTSADEELLQRALEIAEENIDNVNFTVEQFAFALAVSRPLLFTKIKALTNQTPNNFMKTLRMKRAAQLLKTQKLNVSEVAYKVGYRDTRYFSKCFQKQFDQTPSEYLNSQ